MQRAIGATILTLVTIFQSAPADARYRPSVDRFSDMCFARLENLLPGTKDQFGICLQLGEYRFVVSGSDYLYICDRVALDGKWSFACKPDIDVRYPNLEIVDQFVVMGQLVTIFRSSSLGGGRFGEAWFAVHANANATNERGYDVVAFDPPVAFNGLFSDAGELCSNLEPGEEAVELLSASGEFRTDFDRDIGQEEVTLIFQRAISTCPAGERRLTETRYQWTGGSFKLVGSN